MTQQDPMFNLARNAWTSQWSGDEDLEWDKGPSWRMRLLAPLYIDAIRRLLIGELATANTCRWLLDNVPLSRQARSCLVAQIADETRHAYVYLRYLTLLVGDKAVVVQDPDFEAILRDAREGPTGFEDDPRPVLLAYHLLLETSGLTLQRFFARTAPCPLFREINRRIMRDEARHVAFGELTLRSGRKGYTEAETATLKRWLYELWHRATVLTEQRHRLAFWVAGNQARREAEEVWRGVDRRIMSIVT